MPALNDLNLTDLATLKSQLKLTDPSADTLLQGLINSASATFLKLMWRKYFISATRTEDYMGSDIPILFLEAQPVTNVTTVVDSTGKNYPYALDSFSYGFRFDIRSVIFFGDLFWKDENYTVTYTGGYAVDSIEATMAEQGVLALCNLWYRRLDHADLKSRSEGNQVTTSFNIDDIPAETKTISNLLKKVA